MSAIEKAIEHAGGPVELARRLNVNYQRVQYWRRAGAKPQYWKAIELATGGAVKQEDFLADVVDPTKPAGAV